MDGASKSKAEQGGNSSRELELQIKIDAEFEEYKKAQLAGALELYEGLVKADSLRQEEVEPKMEKRRAEFSSMDSYQRIVSLVNNFHFWWPGGWYRQMLEERKLESGADKAKFASDEQLVRDLDELIRERGYDSIAENIAKKENIDRETRLNALADVYLGMREKGHARTDLVR